ncbi:MAG: AAA family ATPase, partial [Clostridia bacterium]|nr:AAA family ATPase [Clostridia bacterium]
MKLLQCYIENFGKLHNFSFDFSSGLNSIKEENGWGKSTFATFIKSMFYGLPSTTKRNLEENERKKYMPWQGGNFGGNIEFETNGKHYRIERFFGKNNSEDKFNLIDLSTGKKSNAFTNNIGEELFGLDGEAFERSAFIPQKILDSNINESISNKLTNLIQGTTEKFNYEEAQTSLNQKRVTLQNNKGTGKIQEIESEIDTIIQKINELNTSALAIKELQRQVNLQETEIQNLTNQQNEVKQQINSYSYIQEQIAHQEMYQKLKVQLETTENEILENQKILKNKNVSPTELNFFHELNEKINQKENELNIKNNNNYLKNRFNELENYFGAENKIPTAEEINTVTNDIARFNALQINLNKSLETQTKAGNTSSKIFLTVILLFSVICLGIGIALFNTVLILSVVLVIVSILGLIFAAFLYLKNMINLKTSGYQHVNYDTQTNQAEISNLKNRIENFINQYEPSQIDYQIAFNNIISNKKELLNIKQQLEIIKISNAEIIKNINEDRNKLENFLSQFNLHESLSPKEQLMLLERTIENINNLQIRRSKEQAELNKFMTDKNFNINSTFVDNLDISDLQNADKQ